MLRVPHFVCYLLSGVQQVREVMSVAWVGVRAERMSDCAATGGPVDVGLVVFIFMSGGGVVVFDVGCVAGVAMFSVDGVLQLEQLYVFVY